MTASSAIGLGIAAITPPNKISANGIFDSDRSYRDFLMRSSADPVAFWESFASNIRWMNPPMRTTNQSDWFPGGTLNITESILKSRQENERIFTVWDKGNIRHLDLSDIKTRVGTICHLLSTMGMSRGDRLLVATSDSLGMLCSSLAALRMGLVAVAVDPSLGDRRRLGRRAGSSGCVGALGWAADMESGHLDETEFERLPVQHKEILEQDWESVHHELAPAVELKATSPAIILSNSSGDMFMLQTAGLALHGLSAYRYLLDGKGKGDIHWFLSPVNYASFLAGTIGAMIAGGQLMLHSGALPDSWSNLCRALDDVQPRVLVIQAKTIEAMAASFDSHDSPHASGFSPSLCVVEGSNLPPRLYLKTRHELFRDNTHLVHALSRPEVSGFISGANPATTSVKPGSCSLHAPGIPLLVTDMKAEPCQPFHGGLLAVRSAPPGMAVSLQQQTPPVMLPVKARMDRDGFIWPVGEMRLSPPDDSRVPSTEIEAYLASLPGIDAAAVVVVRDEQNVEHTRAFLVADETKMDEIVSAARKGILNKLGPRSVPDSFQIVPGLPVSRSGKLLRSVLRRVTSGDTEGIEQMEQVTDKVLLDTLIHGSGVCEDPERNNHGPMGIVGT